MTLRIVGIGASAGGLEAIAELLGALPTENAMAYVVVQHLDRTHGSLLSEILAKQSVLPVATAVDGDVVQANHVYVIPPNATLTVVDGRLRLAERPVGPVRHHPIDAFFESLATSCHADAIGVVLSGGDSDGSLGIRAIKREGGVVFAQTPETAKVPNMPRYAIDTGCVDTVLRPREIAAALGHLDQPFSVAAVPASEDNGETGAVAPGDEPLLQHILAQLRAAHSLDFTHYKRRMLRRRIDRRMMLRGIRSLAEYSALIDGDPRELAALHQDFLIRVTEFFRDPESFDALRVHVFPSLRERGSTNAGIRIWVPGCATGEEVYSLAIALVEFLGDDFSSDGVQIFGTDVSSAALEKARTGVWAADALKNVGDARVQRFFVSHDGQHSIAKEIRDLCIFARQDVTRDPAFSRLDLISCRNLLIYLDEVAQRRVLQVFHFALQPEGMVLFGPAESVGQSSDLFELVDGHVRLYRRRAITGSRASIARFAPYQAVKDEEPAPEELESLTRDADRLLLARFAPASLVIDEQLNIQQFRGRTGQFLEPVSGPPSVNVQRLVRPEILVELLPAIREAGQSGRPVRRGPLRLDTADDVTIEVIPIVRSRATAYLVLLEHTASNARSGREATPVSALPESEKDRRLVQLQREVDAMRDYLQSAIQEHGTVTEQLKSAHEEMLAANEEFQSTNEELETSAEELQSTNEELTTTIEELRNRNRDLAALNIELDRVRVASDRALAYADVIIETVGEPLAVLDREETIRRVNNAFVADIGIARKDVEGRRWSEVHDGLWDIPELRQRLRAVFDEDQAIEDREITLELPVRGRRVVSLSARKIPGDEARSDLLLVAISDVTDRANINAELLANSRRKDEFLATLAHELRHPLTPIAHAIHLLRLGHVDEATAALYETIDTQAQRLLHFVNELLDVARISRNLIQIKHELVDLVTIVRQATETVFPLLEARHHHLTVKLPGIPLRVSGDSVRLSQVVTNLLENAIKFTPPGGEITVALEPRGTEAMLSVLDNGIGIAPDDLAPIFDLFAQADSARTQFGAGLGLGLSIVRDVLELHGGRVEARSNGLGAGSEFCAWIPLLAADKPAEARPDQPAAKEPQRTAVRSRRVMIVDDHDEITTSFTRLLRTWGHEVEVAKDGPSALSLAKRFQPERAILDVGLPGMSGYELAHNLRESFPAERLRLIALTGYGDLNVRDRCHAAGFDVCVIKPGNIDELQALIADDLPSARMVAVPPNPSWRDPVAPRQRD